MNISDSERAITILETMGYKPASKQNEADLILINACSVRGSAIDRIHGMMPAFKILKEKNKKLKLVLTGCLLKVDRKKFEENFDYILDIKDLPRWPHLLGIRNQESGIRDYLKIKPKYTDEKIVYIPISNGCDNFCTYCAVPYTRDRLKCRSHKDVLSEVKSVIKNGAREIWLLGQNVNDYKSPADSSIKFPKLLKLVNNIPGDFIIKFTSPHPKNFSKELIKIMASCKKIAHYLNLPMQSGDNKILKAMNRPYTAQQYKTLVKKIRRAIPDIKLSTDVIVGFPGETKKQFENTLKLFKELNFDMGYIARFSPRPGTLAAKMKDDVSPKEKARRWNIINTILLKKWSRRK